MMEVAKYWVEKTQEATKEQKRRIKIRELFLKEFGILPSEVLFVKEQNYEKPSAVARTTIELQKEIFTVEDQRITKIVLETKEVDINYDMDWSLYRDTNAYQWKKYIKGYAMKVCLYYE